MEIIVIPQKRGLTVKFLNLTKVPPGITFEWDFGDSSVAITEKSPTHIYTESGFYEVTVTASEGTTMTLEIAISDKVETTLSGSIYHLIDGYLPTGIIESFPYHKKKLFIEKWQLYMQPIVSREIGEEIEVYDYNNELKYEALENQLIMEAAMLDFLTVEFTNFLQAKSTTSGGTTTIGQAGIKKIVTGPSEVEYFNSTESDKDILSSITKAMSPGGFLETLRQNLCTLAARLEIFLPFCEQFNINVIAPSVANKRNPIRYDGPNPPYPVKKGP